jgi:hypothetical protein
MLNDNLFSFSSAVQFQILRCATKEMFLPKSKIGLVHGTISGVGMKISAENEGMVGY